MSNPNPIDPVRRVLDQLKAEADKLGLDLYQAVMVPSATGSSQPDMFQCVFILKPEALMDGDEVDQMGIDKQFEALVSGFERDVQKEKFEEKKENAAEDLKKWLEGME